MMESFETFKCWYRYKLPKDVSNDLICHQILEILISCSNVLIKTQLLLECYFFIEMKRLFKISPFVTGIGLAFLWLYSAMIAIPIRAISGRGVKTTYL